MTFPGGKAPGTSALGVIAQELFEPFRRPTSKWCRWRTFDDLVVCSPAPLEGRRFESLLTRDARAREGSGRSCGEVDINHLVGSAPRSKRHVEPEGARPFGCSVDE